MKRFISLFASLLVCTFGAAWFSQDSINAYWQQTYHQASPLEPLSEYEWWRTGAQLQQNAYAFSDDLKARLAGQPTLAEPEPQIAQNDGASEQDALNASEPHEKNRPADGRQPQTAQNGGQPDTHRLPIAPPANIVLGQGDKVFLRRLDDAGRCAFCRKKPEKTIRYPVGESKQTKHRTVLSQVFRLAEHHRADA